MPRRGENIRKRKDGRWEARYPNGKNEKGINTYRSVYGKSYREVKEKRQRAMTNNQQNKPESHCLFRDLAYLWLEEGKIRLKESTVYRYSYLLETHILPELGPMEICHISETVINRYLARKSENGRLDGKSGLSPAYVRSIMLIVSAVMNFAAEHQMCDPLHIALRKPAVRPHEPQILTRELQIKLERNLLNNINETKLGVYISLYTGLRIGEICALSWQDIDLANQLIYVRHTVIRTKSETDSKCQTRHSIDSPKTRASLRCIPICSTLMRVLASCVPPEQSVYVVSGNSQFLSPRTYEYRYRQLLKESKIPHINYHSLRHTFATRCIESGVDVKSLCEILGHANVSITLNTYVHSSMELKRAQLEKLTL